MDNGRIVMPSLLPTHFDLAYHVPCLVDSILHPSWMSRLNCDDYAMLFAYLNEDTSALCTIFSLSSS